MPKNATAKDWADKAAFRLKVALNPYSEGVMDVFSSWMQQDEEGFLNTDFQALIDGLDPEKDAALIQALEMARQFKIMAIDWTAKINEDLADEKAKLEAGQMTQEEYDNLVANHWITTSGIIDEKLGFDYAGILKNILANGGEASDFMYRFVSDTKSKVEGRGKPQTEKKEEEKKVKPSNSAVNKPAVGTAAHQKYIMEELGQRNQALEIDDYVTYTGDPDGTYRITAGSEKGDKVTITKVSNSHGQLVPTSEQKGIVVKVDKISGYATGGYTGAWGPEGKLAVLHEKELVLNKSDTENILKSVDMLSSINEILDNQNYLQNLIALTAEAFNTMTNHDDILQQEVTIHADFPNVTDHTEIEEAINNLINGASQYAQRNTYDRYLNQIK